MPYDDNPPGLVLPDCETGRYMFNKHVRGTPAEDITKFCPEWKDSHVPVLGSVDYERPYARELNACSNRRSDGVRYNNWCYRCVAGFPFVAMHVYDAVRPSDRPITVFDKPSR